MKVKLLLLVITLISGTIALAGGNPPTANFSVSPSTTVLPGTTVCFTDQSTVGLADDPIDSWDWTFAGQAPNYSTTDPNMADPPCVTYNTAGSYQVCLTAGNPAGTDQLCQTINVVPPANIGTENGNTLNNYCAYYLSDDGGQFGNYSDNTSNTVTLCTGTTDFAALSFGLIDLVAGDNILVYDGPNTSSPLVSTITSAANGTTPSVWGGSTCITVQFNTDGSGNAQGFLAQFVCHNNLIISGQNGNVLYGQCGSNLYDSGFTSNYGNNENYTVTICADNATDVVQLYFNQFGLASGDQLNFYDGVGTSGQVIYTALPSDAGNFLLPNLTVSGLSQCMTVEFISNGSGTAAGFNASIDCLPPPPPCNANPIAADNFDAATLICDFSQYCGTTSSFYGVDMDYIGQTSVFDGSIENNSWLSFVADASTAQFNVNVTNCSSGIQIGIYDVSAGGVFTWLSPEIINGGIDYTSVNNGFLGSGVLNGQNMVPGNTYYIMVDGFGGDVCDYTLTAGIGVQLPDPQASPDLVLDCGDPGTVSVVDLNGSTNVDWNWTWNGTSTGGPTNGSSLDVSGFAPGTYNFTVEATDFSACSVTPVEDYVSVTINPCPLPTEFVELNAECINGHNVLNWTTASESNVSHFEVERSLDLISFKSLGKVTAVGNSEEMNHYSFQTEDSYRELIYYRIKSVDINGQIDYSPVISNQNCNGESELFNSYYNSAEQVISIQAFVPASNVAEIILTDLTGRIIYSGSQVFEKGNTVLTLPVEMQNGIMLVHVLTDKSDFTTKHFIR